MARWYDGSKPHDESYTGPMKGQHVVVPRPEPKPVVNSENEDPELFHYAVMFEVSIDGEQTFTEKVFARDQLTAVARAAWAVALKGHTVISVRSVSWKKP